MKKLMVLVLATTVLVGCQSDEGYKYSLIRQIAEKEGVPMNQVKLSFQESCMVDVGPSNDNESIFYAQVGDNQEIYEYYSGACAETTVNDFRKTLYSKDGKLPKTLEEN